MNRNIPNNNFFPTSSGSQSLLDNEDVRAGVAKFIAEKAMVVIARVRCDKCTMLKRIMQRWELINSRVLEVELGDERAMLALLRRMEGEGGRPRELPAVYVGGKLVGNIDDVFTSRIKGEFLPMLRDAGAF